MINFEMEFMYTLCIRHSVFETGAYIYCNWIRIFLMNVRGVHTT